MKKDREQSGKKGVAEKRGAGAAYSGFVFAPVWVQDEPSAGESNVDFALARMDANQEMTPLFGPADLFDILEVVQMLAEKLSGSPLVEPELRTSLEKVSRDLTTLNQAQGRPIMVTRDLHREPPSLKVLVSQKH